MHEAYIEVTTADGTRRVSLSTDKPLTIGRSTANELAIVDDKASRNHCQVEWTGQGFQLRDLKSTNGTRMGDRRVDSMMLNPGDTFRVGKTLFLYMGPAAKGGAPAPPSVDADNEPEADEALSMPDEAPKPGTAVPAGAEETVPMQRRRVPTPGTPGMAPGMAPGPAPAAARSPIIRPPTHLPGGAGAPPRRTPPRQAEPARAHKPVEEPLDQPAEEEGDPILNAEAPLEPIEIEHGLDVGASPDESVHPLNMDDSADGAASLNADDNDDAGMGEDSGVSALSEMASRGDLVENDVALINARGETVHPAGPLMSPPKAARGLRRATPGQPVPIDDETHEGTRLLRVLVLACANARATDVHFEPKQDKYTARLRVDGQMVEAANFTKQTAGRLVGVVKILGDIDIAQRNTIQEGHFSSNFAGRRVDYRVSFTPAMYGQKLVLRVLDLANAPKHTSDLMMPDWMLRDVRRVSKQDAGMILVAGPTGSGKTTTLYSVLRDIDVNSRNVITIEDPVEYQIAGVTQIPVDEHRGNNFATLLRSILRQDPDVILLGEIRDKETAQTAMQAAMTGHLVLSTVHAKDTISTVFRLLDLGVEPYLVAQGLNLVISQRLVRVLCPECKEAKKPTPQQTMKIGRSMDGLAKVYVPVGCSKCLGTGYAGRRGIYEMLAVNDNMRDVILKTPTIQALREETKLSGFTTLQQAGYKLASIGLTSMEEVERVTGMD